jgi:hypothetical protein
MDVLGFRVVSIRRRWFLSFLISMRRNGRWFVIATTLGPYCFAIYSGAIYNGRSLMMVVDVEGIPL